MSDVVPFLDLKQKNLALKADFQSILNEVLESGYYLLGSKLESFEKKFARLCESSYAIGVGSGLDALTLSLFAQIELGNLKKGDQIAVQANTFVATFLSILNAGLIPVPIDVSNESFSVEPEVLDKFLSENTVAGFVSVHLYGYMHKTALTKQVCQRHKVLLFEDAAQAHGAKYDGVSSGAWGIAGAFSFYPGKNLGALGDGGAITTSDEDTHNIVKKLRNYGSDIKYHHDLVGTNSRLDELQAGFLSLKLDSLMEETHRRREIAEVYAEEIVNDKIVLPNYDLHSASENHAYHLFVAKVEDRGEFIQHLQKKGIAALIHYPIPAYKQKCFGNRFIDFMCPNSDLLSELVVSLPLYGSLTEKQIEAVINACKTF